MALAVTACKKQIDGPDHSTLTTSLIFETSRDLDNLLYGAYGALANGNTLTGNWKLYPELLADHVQVNIDDHNNADPYQQVYNRNLTQAQYPENWRLGYTAIQNANTVLYAIDKKLITKEKDPEFNDATRDRMMGEAYFIRALCHFELLRFYGKQYLYSVLPVEGTPGVAAESNSSPGIVLRTDPLIDINGKEDVLGLGRASVELVYQQVIADLKAAEMLLPPVSLPRRGRATSYAASAILARVYFQQNNYPAALTAISKVIGNTPGLISTEFVLVRANGLNTAPTTAQAEANVAAAFRSTSTSAKISENIFDLVSTTGYPVNNFINRKYMRTAVIEPSLAVSNAFLTAANFHVADGRRTGLLSTVTGTAAKTYSRKYDQNLMNIPVIRSAELLLDRAEINAILATGQANGSAAHLAALEDLKLIRGRSIANAAAAFPTATNITASTILAEVRTERIRELAFEGDRLHNLRRMQAMVGPGDRPAAAALGPNSNRLLFKIPDAEIRASKNIVQNPDVD